MVQVLADIEGSGPPTENTPGAVGQIYVDTETALRWECIESHHETRYKGVRVFYDWKCRGLDPDFLATDADIEKTRKEAQNKSIAKLVTLPASKWDADTKSQNVMVMGVLADERVQLVTSTPRTTSARAYTNAGIALTGRKENMVTFTAETIPTEDIKLYVVRQEIKLSEYITFSSPESFSITVSSPKWDGTMEYSTDATTWTTWTGESVSAVADDTGLYSLYFRGTGNTIIAYDNDEDDYYQWEISGSNVYCDGNIETLLDYIEAGSGKHPTMANYCYSGMFCDCTSLVTAPDLPATTLAYYCYYSMFGYCTSLKLSSTQTEEYTIAYRIPANGVGTTATNTMTNMFIKTGGTFTGTPVINTTYYLHKDNSIVQ